MHCSGDWWNCSKELAFSLRILRCLIAGKAAYPKSNPLALEFYCFISQEVWQSVRAKESQERPLAVT